MTPTTQKIIDRAAAQIVRDLCRLRIPEIDKLPAGDRSGLPISLRVTTGPKGAVRYVEARLGHYNGYTFHSDPRILGFVLNGQMDEALTRARLHAEMAVEDALVERGFKKPARSWRDWKAAPQDDDSIPFYDVRRRKPTGTTRETERADDTEKLDPTQHQPPALRAAPDRQGLSRPRGAV